MSRIVCVYSKERDGSTDFLELLYKHICSVLSAKGMGYDMDSDDDSVENIYSAIEDADMVVFLGHGDSNSLFASAGDGYKLFDQDTVRKIADKQLFLLACSSADFIKKFRLNNAIGFGKLPTSIDDVRNWKNLHSIYIEDFIKDDINIYNNALVNILVQSISTETILDYSLLYKRIQFQTSIEIVKCLSRNKENLHYRQIADLLFYFQKDIRIQNTK